VVTPFLPQEMFIRVFLGWLRRERDGPSAQQYHQPHQGRADSAWHSRLYA
jgi:hypothetical protein